MSDRSPQQVFEALLRESAERQGVDVHRGPGLLWANGWRERFDLVLDRYGATFRKGS